MKPRAFEYIRPTSVEEVVEVLARHGDEARVLAGGQSLIPMMNFRLLTPAAVVDVRHIRELDEIHVADGFLQVGAAVTQNRLLSWPALPDHAPLLACMMPWVGHFQTRNRGTVCGSIAHADPSAEIPLALAILGGEVVLRSARGERRLSADEFQLGMLSTAREPDEFVTAVRFPTTPGAATAFRETSRRRGDFALVAIGALRLSPQKVRVGIGGAAERPFVRELSMGDGLDAQIAALADELETYDDLHASPQMRRDLVRRMAPAVLGDLGTGDLGT
jgi:2-furoyl-CoA dehydrogenase FAD binding subunit